MKVKGYELYQSNSQPCNIAGVKCQEIAGIKHKDNQQKHRDTQHQKAKTINQPGTINRGRQLGKNILRSSSTHRKAGH
jgi:hypothetical protein